MAEQDINNTAVVNKEESEDGGLNIHDIIDMFVPRWRWFLASVIVCMAVAVLYLMRATPVYTRNASVLIKDDSKNSTANGVMSQFADMGGMFKVNSNVKNELLTIQSPELMGEVVAALHLDEVYTTKDGLRTVDLYKKSPVSVTFSNKQSRPVGFRITIVSGTEFDLTHLVVDGENTDEKYTGRMGSPVHTTVGNITVRTTGNYTPDYDGKTISYYKGDLNATADAYARKLNAALGDKEATIINMSIDDPSTQKADDILNTLVKFYNVNWVKDKNRVAVSTSQFINSRLGVIEGELGHVDSDISSYKSAHLVPDIQAVSDLYLQQSAENNQKIVEVNDQLATARYIRGELDGKHITQPLPSNSSIGNANSGLEKQIGDYNEMVLQRNQLVENSGENNPLVKDLTSSILSMQKAIKQSIDNLIVSLNTQVRSLKREESTATGKLSSSPTQAKYLLSVERQQKVKEQLYLYLLQKREENELSQAFTAYNTRVITHPRGSQIPTSPKRNTILLAAFLIGLIIPAGGIYAKESLNTTLRGRKDLESVKIPFAGEIPQYGEPEKKLKLPGLGKSKHHHGERRALVVSEGNRNTINEAFRVLRSNIEFMMGKDKEHNVIVSTSFNPGSGKSFITMNLAQSFAIKGKRVLVIDGDLRHGSTSAYVGSPAMGMSDWLAGRVDDYNEIVLSVGNSDKFFMVPIGTIPPNPTELLEGPRFAQLLQDLRPQFDYIFIDCPPIDIVADTQIIEKLADRTIFVVRAGLLERTMIPELNSIYQEKRFKNMSLVLNGTQSTAGRYGYRYGYKYGYRYGYYGYYGKSYTSDK